MSIENKTNLEMIENKFRNDLKQKKIWNKKIKKKEKTTLENKRKTWKMVKGKSYRSINRSK